MKKYLEGDIIIIANQTYVCEIANEEKAVFQAYDYPFITGKNRQGCGGEDSVPCNEIRILKKRMEFNLPTLTKYGRLAKETNDYPIIGHIVGKSCCCPGRPMWDIYNLKLYYPELYTQILEREYSQIIESIREDLKKEHDISFPTYPSISGNVKLSVKKSKSPAKKSVVAKGLKVSYKSNKKK